METAPLPPTLTGSCAHKEQGHREQNNGQQLTTAQTVSPVMTLVLLHTSGNLLPDKVLACSTSILKGLSLRSVSKETE